jgi:uncharacterized protein YdeI (BOF family)
MQLRNRFLTNPGLLCSIVFTAAFFIAAIAVQPQFARSQPLAQQGTQPPQQRPDAQPDPSQPSQQPDQSDAKAVVVTGKIVKSGAAYILRDATGVEYRLDAPDKAQPYEGKSVRITGKLEAETKLLHVESIEELNA